MYLKPEMYITQTYKHEKSSTYPVNKTNKSKQSLLCLSKLNKYNYSFKVLSLNIFESKTIRKLSPHKKN